MPQMGVSVAEGTIVAWRKRVGDWVEADEAIVEISTDKVETEIPSPASGRVSEVLVEAGATVDVGTLLARIDGEARPGVAHADEGPSEPEPEATGHRPQATGNGNGHAPPVSPVVRRMADEHGVDLSQVEGSGRRGRVTKKDLLAFLEDTPDTRHPTPDTPAADTPAAEPLLHSESPYREEPVQPAPANSQELSVMRKSIGAHMVRSLQTAAHCTTVVEADMSRIEEARGRLSYLPFVARATIAALREFPMLNATLEGDRLTVHDEVNLGIAVSLGEEGLIVPVVHDAHELSHEGLAARIKDLAERARSKRLTPDEVSGGTFTITNPGAFGALLATPIINQPQVAILDLEAVTKRPVVVGGDSIAIRPMTYLCMSWDHRALDGALAAQFLSAVRRQIEGWDG
jgi:pyruvate/2-oxoglutarate dehydrogenase complex dihydrolipoamide acyltransferase (E2) component